VKLSAVKVGKWYETKRGVGKCVQAGGWHPPAAKFQIVAPFPLGVVFVTPREIVRELEESDLPPGVRA
jgi:hypothetical protein